MRIRLTVLAALLAALALVAAGCGSSDESEATPAAATGTSSSEEAEEEEEASTPEEAIEEIGEVRTLLDSALGKYRAGESEQAEEIVGDAYLEHFEHVEGPLEERDHELMEDIEKSLATELREKIKAGAPAAEIEELIEHVNEHLDEAEAALKK